MAVYQRKFTLNNRSNTDFGLIVCAINPDDGEMDSYLTMESVYTESFDGSKRHDYGAKYTESAVLYITMVKNNYADFSRKELREILNWLTGLRKASWLNIYNDDTGTLSIAFLGRITDVKLQKMDSRIIGITAEFTANNPWGYSDVNVNEFSLNGSKTLSSICNCSDESSVYVYPNVTFINKISNGTLRIYNNTTGEETLLTNLGMNEVITMNSNKIIYSDNEYKVFGEDFNFNWLRFAQGYNHIDIEGTGHLIIEHRDIIKAADAFDDNSDMNTEPAVINYLLLSDVDLYAWNWVEEVVPNGTIPTYSQDVNITGVSETSKINLQATEEQLLELQENEIEMQIVNYGNKVKAYAYGGVPVSDYHMQVTIENDGEEISSRHDTVYLYKDAWYGQGSIYTQPVYIKDLTENSIIDLNLTDLQIALLDNSETTLLIKNEDNSTIAYALGHKPANDYSIDVIITETITVN